MVLAAALAGLGIAAVRQGNDRPDSQSTARVEVIAGGRTVTYEIADDDGSVTIDPQLLQLDYVAGGTTFDSPGIRLDADEQVRRVTFTLHSSQGDADVVTVDAPRSHELRSRNGEPVDISDLVRRD